ncbi:hypothetical protein BDQ12DRAFT_666704 [Crucibulum laeve]|uniref:Uncharacterized protein n=1 Tax=Crucibulum laeve TaxID=68775 RepID=A0A5C3LXC8_9AGAR|nr:hypothetical protein BDQ12DRAFT_666704 [Crucibulum laeve]
MSLSENVTIIDDRNSYVQYSAPTDWFPKADADAEACTLMYTQQPGASASLKFNGTAVQIFGAVDPGVAVRYALDGDSVQQAGGSESATIMLLFAFTNLTVGQHSVEVENLSSQVGLNLFLDYFVVHAPISPFATTKNTTVTLSPSSITQVLRRPPPRMPISDEPRPSNNLSFMDSAPGSQTALIDASAMFLVETLSSSTFSDHQHHPPSDVNRTSIFNWQNASEINNSVEDLIYLPQSEAPSSIAETSSLRESGFFAFSRRYITSPMSGGDRALSPALVEGIYRSSIRPCTAHSEAMTDDIPPAYQRS